MPLFDLTHLLTLIFYLTAMQSMGTYPSILTKGLKLHHHCYLMGKLGFGERDFLLRGSVGNHDKAQSANEPAHT